MKKLNLLFIAIALFAFIACQGTGQKATEATEAAEEVVEEAAMEVDSAAADTAVVEAVEEEVAE